MKSLLKREELRRQRLYDFWSI